MSIVSNSLYKGKTVLAIQTSLRPRAFAQTKLSQTVSEQGIILHTDGSISKWGIEGTYSNTDILGDPIVMYGEQFEGASLLEILEKEASSAWESLYSVFLVLQKSSQDGRLTHDQFINFLNAGPGSLIVGLDGSILILPSEIYIKSLASFGIKAEIEQRYSWIHPDTSLLDVSRGFAFLAGTLMYRLISGKPAFEYKGEDTNGALLAHYIQNNFFEPLNIASWTIRPDVARVINDFLDIKVATSINPILSYGPSFLSLLDEAKLNTPESKEFLVLKKKAESKRKKAERNKLFVKKYKGAIITALVVCVVVGLGMGLTIRDAKAKPNTLGLEPYDVIYNFYQAIDQLDQEIPRLYSVKGVKYDYDSFITNLYVASKVRETYEQNGGILSPSDLLKTDTIEGRQIYGITGLIITLQEQTKDIASFFVSLYVWLPFVSDSGSKINEELEQEVPLSIYHYTETIGLSFVKDRWLISEFVPIERKELELSPQEILDILQSNIIVPWLP